MKAFAEALNIPQSTLSNYLAGDIRPGNKLQTKLRGLGCDIEWLMTGKKSGSNISATILDAVATFQVKMYPVAGRVQGGKGPLTFEYNRMEPGPPGVIVDEGYWFVVKGDSMEPRYYKGEMVFVRKDLKPSNGDFAVVVWDDYTEAAIKQVFYKDGNVILRSINASHEPILVSQKSLSFIAKITHTKSK